MNRNGLQAPSWIGWGTLVAGACMGWLVAGGASAPLAADSPQATVSGQAVTALVVPGATGGSERLYLIDTQRQVLSVYSFDPARSKLKLAVVRHYTADHRLQEYNNEPPLVAEIEQIVQ